MKKVTFFLMIVFFVFSVNTYSMEYSGKNQKSFNSEKNCKPGSRLFKIKTNKKNSPQKHNHRKSNKWKKNIRSPRIFR